MALVVWRGWIKTGALTFERFWSYVTIPNRGHDGNREE